MFPGGGSRGGCTLFGFFHGASWHSSWVSIARHGTVIARRGIAIAVHGIVIARYGLPRTVMVLQGNAMGVPWVSITMP